MKKFKTINLLCLLFLLAALIVGCSDNGQASAQPYERLEQNPESEKNSNIMGLDDTFAPMGFRDERGNLVGFDIELANEAAKRMDITIEFQPIDWSMKETELNAGNIDFIWNGYSVTGERKEKVAFSAPYLKNKQIIVVLANSDIKSKDDLDGKNIAVQAESSALDAINSEPEFVKKVNELSEFSTNNEAFMDLEAKRSDALIVDEVLARYYMKQNGQENYKILNEDFGDEEYAVGLRKSDTKLLEKLNTAFDEMKNDGTYGQIYARWFSEN